MILFVFFLLVCGVVFLKFKINRPALSIGGGTECLSLPTTTSLRGFACVLIILHHLSLQVSAGGLMTLYEHVGQYTVGLFFFLSGYGFTKQHAKKGDAYLKGFLRKHILKLLIPLFCCLIIYSAVFIALGTVSVRSILLSFLSNDVFPDHSWYIYASVFLYIVWALSFRFLNNKTIAVSVIAVAIVLFYFLGSGWTSTMLCFPVGCLTVLYGEKIKTPKFFWIFAAAGCFGLLLGGSLMLNRLLPQTGLNDFLFFVVKNASAVSLCILVLILCCYFNIGNPVLDFIGKHSLYIYLIHGLVYKLLAYVIDCQKNSLVYCAVSLVASIVVGYVFSVMYQRVASGIKKRVSSGDKLY